MDQCKFIAAIRPCILPSRTKNAEASEKLSEEERRVFLSSLMTAAYSSLTRPDGQIYITALQRQCSAPCIADVRKLNKVIKYLQQHPQKLIYRHLGDQRASHLVAFSDAGFSAEADKGRSQRGMLLLRTTAPVPSPISSTPHTQQGHLIDWISTAQRRVTRSTFASELVSAVDAVDASLLTREYLREVNSGVSSATLGRQHMKTPGGGSSATATIQLFIDARSVLDSISSIGGKQPAEKGQFINVQWMREQIQNEVISVAWTDTRDMAADGMTKGTIPRDAIVKAMIGEFVFNHETVQSELR
eukprot:4774481-Amphidinium_carterae.1